MLDGDHPSAEDAVQEALTKAWLKIDRFRGESALRTWLFRLVANECSDTRRRRRPIAVDDGMFAAMAGDTVAEPDAVASAAELREALDAALLELPWRQRAAWLLREVEELSYQEIAEILQTSTTVVRGQLHRARATLAVSDGAMAMNSDNGSPAETAGDELRLGTAATALRDHTDDRFVEVAGDMLRQLATISRPSHPILARTPVGSFRISEQVLASTLQRTLDVVPHCEVTEIRIKADRDRYTGVTLMIVAEYPHPLIPLADHLRDLAVAHLRTMLGAVVPRVTTSAMHVHVEDVSETDPKLG